MQRALPSLKTLIVIVVIFTNLPSVVCAISPTMSQELAENKKTVYELPEAGTILPNNPLFQIKRIRDEAVLAMSSGEDKARMLILLSDKYTSYGHKMTKLNKPQSAFSSFEQSISYQEELVHTLKKLSKSKHESREEICYKATQSNLKQAEVLRSVLGELSASDQITLAKVLEKNIEVRKLLEDCNK